MSGVWDLSPENQVACDPLTDAKTVPPTTLGRSTWIVVLTPKEVELERTRKPLKRGIGDAGDAAPGPVCYDGDATETIDMSKLSLDRLSSSGSYFVQGIGSSSIGKLFDALPIPVLLLDQSLSIMFANEAWEKIGLDHHDLEGLPAHSLFPHRETADKAKSLMEDVLTSRRTRIAEGLLKIEGTTLWGRVHFRSFRLEEDRFVLTLIEDLTAHKKQLLLQAKLQETLKQSHEHLEEVVQKRTAELSRTNKILTREVAQRKQVQDNLARLFNKLRDTLKGTVVALASMAEKRDPHTAGHHRRVAELVEVMAKRMGLTAKQVTGVSISAALHDIGKIYVPAEFLSKPGVITDLEREIIREHPRVGHDILKEVDFMWPVAEIVYQHHERMDGSGYPRGLRGEEILMEARILAVADVVEAMVSHRPYRGALQKSEALDEIASHSGALYDRDVVRVCLETFRSGFSFSNH